MMACRACRVPIAAQDGCAVCKDFKAQLISVDEDDAERPSLSDVSAEVIASLRMLVRRGKVLIEDPTKPKLFAEGARLTIAAGNTVAKVLESARKLQTDGLAAIRNMSFLERAELYIGWYASLPPAYRGKVRQGQEQMERETSLALPPGAQ